MLKIPPGPEHLCRLQLMQHSRKGGRLGRKAEGALTLQDLGVLPEYQQSVPLQKLKVCG